MSTKEHWDRVYTDKPAESLSWYQQEPGMSLRLLRTWAPPPAAVIDVGAGASLLADRLLAAGWSDVTVLDVSAQASALLRGRLGATVRVITADLLSWTPDRRYDAWHDRAVFHFLNAGSDRARYLETAAAALRPGGALVLGTFAPDGPSECSGLPTARYTPAELAALFSDTFDPVDSDREEHRTPWGAVQGFSWVVLRRR